MYDRFDGFTSTFQDKLFKGYDMEIHNQIFYTTLCSCILSLAGKLSFVFSLLLSFGACRNLLLSYFGTSWRMCYMWKHHGDFLDAHIHGVKFDLAEYLLPLEIKLIQEIRAHLVSFLLPCRMYNHVWLSETFLDCDILCHSVDVLINLILLVRT